MNALTFPIPILLLFVGCCAQLQPQTEVVPQPTPSLFPNIGTCTDSDGGIDYNIKGTARKGGYTAEDYCFTTNPKVVWEYYCTEDGTIESEMYTCATICSDGRCGLSSPTPNPVPDDSCTSSSDCGYKQKCISGECQTVECTSDSQCSGCKRCSDYVCVSCGRGPSGCYC